MTFLKFYFHHPYKMGKWYWPEEKKRSFEFPLLSLFFFSLPSFSFFLSSFTLSLSFSLPGYFCDSCRVNLSILSVMKLVYRCYTQNIYPAMTAYFSGLPIVTIYILVSGGFIWNPFFLQGHTDQQGNYTPRASAPQGTRVDMLIPQFPLLLLVQ